VKVSKTILRILILLIFVTVNAQQERGISGENNWLNGWTEFSPKSVDYGKETHVLVGDITEDMTLYKKDVYLLVGNVFVTNSAILSIEPGTVILADSKSKATLTIAKDAAIIAEGTETDPIVFTSNKVMKKAGDWGGIILLGDAPNNRLVNNTSASRFYPQIDTSNFNKTFFGGENVNSNSGILQYVRIEYAGKKSNISKPSNALLLACVGNNTIVNNVMISYSEGNSFNVIGGALNLDHLVSYKSSGTDYKFNFGAQCNINNFLAVRSPYMSSSMGSRCMQVISYDKSKSEDVDFSKKETSVKAQNLTFLTDSKTLESDIDMGLVKECVYVGENVTFIMNKSVISGFSKAVLLDEKIEINGPNLEKIQFTNTYFNNCNGNIFTENNMNNEDIENWYGNPVFFNVYSKGSHSETFIALTNKRPDYRLRIGKIMAMSTGNTSN